MIYNNPREIRLHSRDKLWFADIWKANGWDGERPVVRVEFRLALATGMREGAAFALERSFPK